MVVSGTRQFLALTEVDIEMVRFRSRSVLLGLSSWESHAVGVEGTCAAASLNNLDSLLLSQSPQV